MNTLNYVKKTLFINGTLLGFEYRGKEGNIDPYYSGKDTYLLFFDDKELLVHSLEEVFTTPFIDGKTLNEVIDQIVIIES